MKTLPVIITAIAALCLAVPASAQFGQKPQQSRSQLALEKAEAHKTAADIAFAAAEQSSLRGPDDMCLSARPRWPLDTKQPAMLGSGKKGAKA